MSERIIFYTPINCWHFWRSRSLVEPRIGWIDNGNGTGHPLLGPSEIACNSCAVKFLEEAMEQLSKDES